MSQLGNPNDVPTIALAIAAAEAIVLAEDARKECLAGGLNGMSAELMIRCENTAARALRRLGLNRAAPPAPRKSFAEKMAEMEAARGAST